MFGFVFNVIVFIFICVVSYFYKLIYIGICMLIILDVLFLFSRFLLYIFEYILDGFKVILIYLYFILFILFINYVLFLFI